MTRQANWKGSNWIRKERRRRIYTRDHWRCAYCGRRPPVVVLSLDHLKAVNGGEPDNRNENLITACRSCNSARGNRTVSAFVGNITARKIYAQARRPLPEETTCSQHSNNY